MITIKKTLIAASLLFTTLSTQAAPVDGDDWLSTQGNQIIDQNGNPVWLTGANWFGFNATERTFHGLWSVNLESTLQTLADRGINILRVPISTELLWDWRNGVFTVPGVNGSTNPALVGQTDLQVFDRFLEVARDLGMKVMIDVHSAEADNSGHFYTVWYKDAITPEIFYQAWEWITERYKNDDTILAMDIENEPHGKPWTDPIFAKWDSTTDINNFKHACETASNRILAINPNMLVLCEGIESYPRDGVSWNGPDGKAFFNTWWGGNLRGVRDHPIDLGVNQAQLVYSPHDYGPLVYRQKWFFEGFNRQTLQRDAWNDNWLFIHDENIAPLLIGEWGGFVDGADNQIWMEALRDQIVEDQLHHTFWSINPNSGDTGGLLLNDWTTIDEAKYAILEPALWKNTQGKFISLDHEVPLGSSATSVSLNEHYGNQQPSVGISSPSAGAEFTVGTNLSLSVGTNQVSSVNVYLNDALAVAGAAAGVTTLSVPNSVGPFTIRIEGLGANGVENGLTASRTFSAVSEVVLVPSVSISSPSTGVEVTTGQSFDLTVAYENADGFSVNFAGSSQTVLNDNTITLTAPSVANTYSLAVNAVEAGQIVADANDAIDIVVADVMTGGGISCDVGLASTWSGGFVINEVTLTNGGDSAINDWSVTLNFLAGVALSNGWNASYTGNTGSVTASNMPYNGILDAGQSVSFGFQGTFSGTFQAPTCIVN